MASFRLCSFLAFLLSTCPVHSVIIREDCPDSLVNVSTCGYIRVPINRQRPQRGSTSFHFARFPSKSSVSTKNALVVLIGGPGGGIIMSDLTPHFLRFISLATDDVVLVDYRGTGRSDALDCPSVQKNPGIPSAESTERCLTEIGPTVIHCSSESISRDIDALREQLGYQTLDLYALSYGTVVLQHYAALFPLRVRNAVLDSPLPLDQDQFSLRQTLTTQRIYAEKGVNIPKLKQDVEKVLGFIRSSNPKANGTITAEQLYQLYSLTVPAIAQAISLTASTRNLRILERVFLSATPQVYFPQAANVLSYAARFSIVCNDFLRQMPFEADDPPGVRQLKLKRAVSQLPPNAYSPFRPEEASSSRFPPILCSGFPFKQMQPPMLKESTRINALTLFGTLDAVTPIEYKQDLLPVYRRLLVQIPNTGHVVLFESSCGARLIVEFITTGKLSNATLCS